MQPPIVPKLMNLFMWVHGRQQLGTGGGRGLWSPWIFIRGINKVEEGLMVLFFGLVFSVALLPPLKIFLPTPLYGCTTLL